MTFYIYSRKSIITEKGESIENQAELCRQYILSNYPGTSEGDITTYEDEGYSGKSLDRPRFQQMMADIAVHRPDCLVCYRLDRISRSVGDFVVLIEQLNNWGIAFVCIREKFDTDTPMGKAMLYISSVFAQLERETIAQRVRDNMLLLAKTGRWLGGTPPIGFVSERTRELIIDGRSKTACHLRGDPETLAIVSHIFHTFLERQSLSGLQKSLYAQGIRSPAGRPFSLPGLREILQNPVYCTADPDSLAYFTAQRADVCFTAADCGRGLLAYNKRDYAREGSPRNPVEKWIVAAGRHQGLISGKDWAYVQELLAGNRPACSTPNAHNGYALLSGVVRCGRCGSRMFAKARSGQSGVYDYICETKLRLGLAACDHRNLHGPQADQLALASLRPYVRPHPGLIPLLAALKKELVSARPAVPTTSVCNRTAACHRELEHLVAALGTAAPSGAFAMKLRARIAQLEEELQLLEAQRDPPFPDREPLLTPDDLFAALSAPAGDRRSMSLQEQRSLVRLLVRTCRWDGETLHIALALPDSPHTAGRSVFPPVRETPKLP